MSQAQLQIIMSLLDQASGELKAATDQMGDLEKQGKKTDSTTDKMKQNYMSMMGAITAVTGALFAMKKGYDFAKEGAALDLVETKFDRLAVSIGTTGDALMKDLGPAMGGMQSKAEMMQGAMDLMTLGLVKTHDEAIRLAGVAGQLDMNMNQLVLTLTNKTTMRFDALGIKVDGFKEKVKDLEAAGMDADAAFNEAFLRQAEDALELVGSAAETAAGQFAMFEASNKDAMDQLKLATMNIVLPAVVAINELYEEDRLLEEAIASGAVTLFEYLQYVEHWSHINQDVAGSIDYLRAKIEGTEKFVAAYGSRTQEATGSTIIFGTALDDLDAPDFRIKDWAEDAVGALIPLETELWGVTDLMGKLTEHMIFNAAAAGLSREGQIELAIAMGLVDSESGMVLKKLDEMRESYNETGDLEEYTAKVTRYRDVLRSIPANINTRILAQISVTGATALGSTLQEKLFGTLNNQSESSDGLAQGGPLTGVNKVGESGWEYVINGIVIPHGESKTLAALGLDPTARRYIGGPLDMGGGAVSTIAEPDFTDPAIRAAISGTGTSTTTAAPITTTADAQATAAVESFSADVAELAQVTADVGQTTSNIAAQQMSIMVKQQVALQNAQAESNSHLSNIAQLISELPTREDYETAMRESVQDAMSAVM